MVDMQSWVLYMSTFPPRECGIATFTKDLTTAMDKRFNPTLKSKILALNDNGSSFYNYGSKVKLTLNDSYIEQYLDTAKRINEDGRIRLVSIQHEFGIFGGTNGDYLIPFLETLHKPVVVTFHSVIPRPDPDRLRIVRAIAKRASGIVVMAQSAVRILQRDYGVTTRIKVIHHGVPAFSVHRRDRIKRRLGLEGKVVISTFGLINRGKGIEYTIAALPQLVQERPDTVFLVIGETHPQVRKQEGEEYRNSLLALVKSLGLQHHVKFYNKYLTKEEIMGYLEATDIYINAALDANQITSGTVAYAMGAGKAIISTPSLYGREMMQGEKGIIVPFRSSEKIAESLLSLAADPARRKRLEANAFAYGTKMKWNNVASEYLSLYKEIISIKETVGLHKFPAFKLAHLLSLTDDTGVIQHAKHSISNRATGYTVDDNARALLAAVKAYDLSRDSQSIGLIRKYLGFLQYCQRKGGLFHNFMGYDRRFLDKVGSEDSFGRAVWALGRVIDSKAPENVKAAAKFLLDHALPNFSRLASIRGKAFTIMGLYHYFQQHPAKDILEKITFLADALVKEQKSHCSADWCWFEDAVTYSNGILPTSMFRAYQVTRDGKYLAAANQTLDFLTQLVVMGSQLVLIGHKGWYLRNGKRSFHDQQPVDAASMVEAYKTGFEVTRSAQYYKNCLIAFQWFLGKNSLNQALYDEATGGCYDGLLPDCVNLNQGAESTISYLLARLNVEELKRKHAAQPQ